MNKKNDAAHTLIELICVVAIIGVILGLFVAKIPRKTIKKIQYIYQKENQKIYVFCIDDEVNCMPPAAVSNLMVMQERYLTK